MPTQPQVKVVQALNLPRVRRVQRRPQHKFNIKSVPYEITPFMIAPVLPGETMENLLLQARVVSDPIHNPLIGWHQEYYFYYVKHRALGPVWDTNNLLQSMMLDPATDVSTLKAAANSTANYTFKGGMDFVTACLRAVVNEDFRDEGDDYTDGASTSPFGFPFAMVDRSSWLHNLKDDLTVDDDDELPGVDEQEELDILPGFTGQYAQWEIMRDQGLTDLTYEDYLRSYGVTVPKAEEETPEEKHKPELIRFIRSWTYPTNHVDPTTGTPSSAVVWSIAERADKKRFFKEPGFIVGYSVTRPKVYFGSQKGNASALLDNAYAWLPAVLSSHPYTSVKETLDSVTEGILQNQTADYWFDVKDLFIHGDQFVNEVMTHARNHGVELPDANLNAKFLNYDNIAALFKVADGSANYIRQDGVVHLNILSRLKDTTP